MTLEENRRLRDQINDLHKQLQDAPQFCKIPFQLSIRGILNAYREGDVSFEDAAYQIERITNSVDSKRQIIEEIKGGNHPQFQLVDGVVKCKCGAVAISFRDGYLCPTITAYPCKY